MEQLKQPNQNNEQEPVKDPNVKERHRPSRKKEVDLNTKINNYLKLYLKENKKIAVFISILQLFKKKNYAELEQTEIFTSLLNDFSKNKKKYKFTEDIPSDKNIEQIINEFCEHIESEINNNKAIILTNVDQKKMIKLDLEKVIDYFLDIEKSKPPKRKYNKRKKKILQEMLEKKKKDEKIIKEEEKPEALPEIFTKNLYNENLSKSSEDDLYDKIIDKAWKYIGNIKRTKVELDEFETKIKIINKKVQDINKNKTSYSNIKQLIRENQIKLNNIYNKMNNELEAVKKFSNNNYDKRLYDIHRKTINNSHNNYKKYVDKIKNYINTLKQIEIILNDNAKDINEYLEHIIILQNNIIGTPNSELEYLYQNSRINTDNINFEEIIQSFLRKADTLVKEFNDIEKENKKLNNNDETINKHKEYTIFFD